MQRDRRQKWVRQGFREPCFQMLASNKGGGDEQMHCVHASWQMQQKSPSPAMCFSCRYSLHCFSSSSVQTQGHRRGARGGTSSAAPAMSREFPSFFLFKKSNINNNLKGGNNLSVWCVPSSIEPISTLTSQTACSHLTLWWFLQMKTELQRLLFVCVHACVCFPHPESSGCGRLCNPLYELADVCVVAELPECD